MRALNEFENEKVKNETEPTKNISGKTLRSLRVWPAILLIIGMIVVKYLPVLWKDDVAEVYMAAAFAPLLIGLLIVLWWLLASRASIAERFLGVFCLAAITAVTMAAVHPSMIGPGTMTITVPMGTAAFALGASLFSRMLSVRRTVIALLVAAVSIGFSTLLRYDGVWGDFNPSLNWRWVPSAEDIFLAESGSRNKTKLATPESEARVALANPQWSGFRGNDRRGVVSGTQFETDWSAYPPTELWRVSVGPGWSSFALAGNQLFTQEQRGEKECVVCYDTNSGAEIWSSEIESRFSDPLGGPGPRATPTLAGGSLYAMGAEGFLVKLDPWSGESLWHVDLREVADVKPPDWGFCASPLVVGDSVITYAAGEGNNGIVAFDINNGDLVWSIPAGRQSYSSPHLCNIHGNDYIVLLTDKGVHFVDPENGKLESDYLWEQFGYRSLQPYVIGEDSMLVATGAGAGTRRVQFDSELNGKEVWTSKALKPDFNDFVVHHGHLYGFDDTIFVCIDIESGERKWKRGRYGKGQVLLLEDSNAILVISEKGELVLLETNSEEHVVLSRLKVFESKTWNHPIVVGDRLYLRNDREAVCYELPTDGVTLVSQEKSEIE